MNYYENLNFQKVYFPDIFSSYSREKNELEIEEDEIVSREVFKYVYILCDLNEYKNILCDLFHIKIEEDLESFHSIIIMRNYKESYEKDENLKQIRIQFPYALPSDGYSFYISDSINKKIMDISYKVFFKKQNLNAFDIRILKKFSTKEYKTISELKDNLINLVCCYDIKLCEIQKNKSYNKLQIGNYDVLIAPQIVSIILNNKISKEDILIQCNNCILDEYLLKSKEILSNFMLQGKFINNFINVLIYFEEKKIFQNKLYKYINNNLKLIVCDNIKYSKNKINSQRFNELSSNNSIIMVDEIVKSQLDILVKRLEEV